MSLPSNDDELPDTIYKQVKKLCKEGDSFAENKEDAKALDKYYDAWDLLPDNKNDWEAATWILGSIGEIYFKNAKFEKSKSSYESAVHSAGGLGNPYLHLRLGQSHFELGDKDKAGDELMRAFMGADEEIFEDEDPKYLKYLKTLMK